MWPPSATLVAGLLMRLWAERRVGFQCGGSSRCLQHHQRDPYRARIQRPCAKPTSHVASPIAWIAFATAMFNPPRLLRVSSSSSAAEHR